MLRFIVFILIVCIIPYIAVCIIGKIWDKIILKMILVAKWGEILADEYFSFERNPIVEDMTLQSPDFHIRGLLNPVLPEEMKQYIFKLNGISGVIQYIILGIFIFGISYELFGYDIANEKILWISIINTTWMLIVRTPLIPMATSIITFVGLSFLLRI